jgi:hypothetical protein
MFFNDLRNERVKEQTQLVSLLILFNLLHSDPIYCHRNVRQDFPPVDAMLGICLGICWHDEAASCRSVVGSVHVHSRGTLNDATTSQSKSWRPRHSREGCSGRSGRTNSRLAHASSGSVHGCLSRVFRKVPFPRAVRESSHGSRIIPSMPQSLWYGWYYHVQ